MLEAMCPHLSPRGRLILNVLIEGTTFMDMFEGDEHHLFEEGELAALLPDRELLISRKDSFVAPLDTRKDFLTIVFRKPAP